LRKARERRREGLFVAEGVREVERALAAGLTPRELASMATLLRQIRADGVTILMVEHVMRLILDLCDRLSVLQYGELIAHGDAATVAADERVREAYLGQNYML